MGIKIYVLDFWNSLLDENLYKRFVPCQAYVPWHVRTKLEQEWSIDPLFFFSFPEGRHELRQDWITSPCQAKGSVTICIRSWTSLQGEQISYSMLLSFSKMYFSSNESKIIQVRVPFSSGWDISWELRFHAFKKTMKFNQYFKLAPKTCQCVVPLLLCTSNVVELLIQS